MQVCMKASWTLANVASAKDTFYRLDLKVQSRMLYQLLIYYQKSKEKVQSNSLRAIGAILSNCQDIQVLNQICESVTKNFTPISLERLIDFILPESPQSYKSAWNGCVAFSRILQNTYMRSKIWDQLVTDAKLASLCALVICPHIKS